MDKKLFVIVLRYLVDEQTIIKHRTAHREFLDKYYAQGILITSGPQTPCYGGIIMAKINSRDQLESIMKEDPFIINKCAEFNIYEFTVNKAAPGFAAFLETLV